MTEQEALTEMDEWMGWRGWWSNVGLGNAPSHDLDLEWLDLNGRSTEKWNNGSAGFAGIYGQCLADARDSKGVYSVDVTTRTIDDRVLLGWLARRLSNRVAIERTFRRMRRLLSSSDHHADDLSSLAALSDGCVYRLAATTDDNACQDLHGVRVSRRHSIRARTKPANDRRRQIPRFMCAPYVGLAPVATVVHWIQAGVVGSRAETAFGVGSRIDVLVTSVVLESAMLAQRWFYVRFDDTPQLVAMFGEPDASPTVLYEFVPPVLSPSPSSSSPSSSLRLMLLVFDDSRMADRLVESGIELLAVVRALESSSTGLTSLRVDPYLSNPRRVPYRRIPRSTTTRPSSSSTTLWDACQAAEYVARMVPRRFYQPCDAELVRSCPRLLPRSLIPNPSLLYWHVYTRHPCDAVRSVPRDIVRPFQGASASSLIACASELLPRDLSIDVEFPLTRVCLGGSPHLEHVAAQRVFTHRGNVFVTTRPIEFVPTIAQARKPYRFLDECCPYANDDDDDDDADFTAMERVGCFVAANFRGKGTRVWFPLRVGRRALERCYANVDRGIAPIVQWLDEHVGGPLSRQ